MDIFFKILFMLCIPTHDAYGRDKNSIHSTWATKQERSNVRLFLLIPRGPKHTAWGKVTKLLIFFIAASQWAAVKFSFLFGEPRGNRSAPQVRRNNWPKAYKCNFVLRIIAMGHEQCDRCVTFAAMVMWPGCHPDPVHFAPLWYTPSVSDIHKCTYLWPATRSPKNRRRTKIGMKD